MHPSVSRPRQSQLRSSARFTITATAESTVVAVTGEIDATCTQRLREQLTTEVTLLPRALILDLTEVRFCSAQGMAILLTTTIDARAAGIPCAIVTAQRALLHPMKSLRLDHVLQIHHSLADAQNRLASTEAGHISLSDRREKH